MKKYTRRILFFLITIICLISISNSPYVIATDDMPVSAGIEMNTVDDVKVNSVGAGFLKTVENDRFILSYIKSGVVSILDKKIGKEWLSNPVYTEEDTGLQGINKINAQSQLIITWADSNNILSVSRSNICSEEDGTLTKENIENGIKVTYSFLDEKFSIPIVYKLNKDNFEISIETKGIRETGENKICEIALLPFLAAAKNTQKGYFLVPDGCGALINFNNKSEQKYSQQVYGTDPTINKEKVSKTEQSIKLPIYGVKQEDATLFAVINESAAKAKIFAETSKDTLNYNMIYTSFVYRNTINVQLPTKNYTIKDVRILEKTPSNDRNYSVRFYSLPKGSNYLDMANTYKEYLTKEIGIKSKTSNQDVIIETYGYISKTKSFLGFPINYDQKLTTFNDVLEITNEVKNEGINPTIKMSGWEKDEFYKKIPVNAVPLKSLGGLNGFKNLYIKLSKSNIDFYPSADFINVYKSGNGFSKFKNVATQINGVSFAQYAYSLSNFYKNKKIPLWYLIDLSKLKEITEKFTNKLDSYKIKNISLENIGNTVYSNFGSNNYSRNLSVDYIQKAFNNIQNKDYKIMVDDACDYSLQYAKTIINTPTSSSNYFIEDTEVPFYQLALRELIPMSTPSINLESIPQKTILKCYETGISPMYTFIKQDSSLLKGTRLNNLYSVSYDDWKYEFIKTCKELKEFNKKIKNQSIKSHEVLMKNVYKTIFTNGVTVIVNYNSKSIEVAGKTIKGYDVIVE